MSEEGWEQKYIKEAFDTNWVVPLGPNVNGFEKDLEEFVNLNVNPNLNLNGNGNDNERGEGVSNTNLTNNTNGLAKRVVALSSGTAAVHLGLLACGVGPGDEVIVQSFTFCASTHPVTYLGATPVLVDSEPDTWNIDPELLEVAIKDRIAKTGRKPKAIVPVALYGMPYKADRIMEIANKYGIPVVEDAAEGFGSRYKGQVLGTFGKYGVLSFNGNKMITTSGGGALITANDDEWREIMMYATQYRESYPYYQHEKIGFNYRMSNICAGIGRGQMTVVNDHLKHHKHVQKMYEELLKDVKGIHVHSQPSLTPCPSPEGKGRSLTPCPSPEGKGSVPVYDSNYWLCTITIDEDVKVKGQENAYQTIVTGAVGGAAGVIHAAESAHTDCEPNDNVEALRVALDKAQIEARPVWKPMHKQPCYKNVPAYVNGVSESIFKVGMCLPAGPYVSDEDVKYIVDTIKANIL
jgi:dTDP-4-amino-4,6-dideoxygalactose transaminase